LQGHEHKTTLIITRRSEKNINKDKTNWNRRMHILHYCNLINIQPQSILLASNAVTSTLLRG
jgi:hypothetical protein